MAIPWDRESAIQNLIDEIFPNLETHGWETSYIVERAILTPKNQDVQNSMTILLVLS